MVCLVRNLQWWKGVHLVTQPRNTALITLDRESPDQLNEYFGNDVHIDPDVKVPTIPVGLVWNTPSNVKKTE